MILLREGGGKTRRKWRWTLLGRCRGLAAMIIQRLLDYIVGERAGVGRKRELKERREDVMDAFLQRRSITPKQPRADKKVGKPCQRKE